MGRARALVTTAPLRIAIDATAVLPQPTGAGNYTLNLVRALPRVDPTSQYFVFVTSQNAELLGVEAPNLTPVRVRCASRPARLVWEQTGLPLLVRRLGVDVLHSPHYTMPVAKPCRSVVTFCDMTFALMPELHRTWHRRFFPTMMRWSARHADRLIAISESTRQDVMRLLDVPADRIVAIPLAGSPVFCVLPRAEIAAVCGRHGLVPGGYLCYVGVLEPRKDVPTLIDAYARIAGAFPDVPLAIVGRNGWMYESIFRRVEEHGIGNRVRFLGHVAQEELIGLYNGARAFVYPSRYEGFGLPILEAMQCGAPVVTTTVSSMPEVAGDAALLVPPSDAAALAGALERLLSDDALARDLSARGVARAATFSWERCAADTARVYQSIAADGRRP